MFELLRPRLPRLLLAILFGVLSLGSALALAAVSAWLITRAWQMPPVLDLTVAVVAVRALGISRGVLGYCERLASHDTALRAGADVRERLYARLASGPVDAVMRRHTGELVSDIGSSVDDLSDVLVRAVVPISVAAILGSAATVAVAVISPAAAVILAVCLLVAGVAAPSLAARAAMAAEQLAGTASFAAGHRRDARARACARTAGQRPPRRRTRRRRPGATRLGPRNRPGGGTRCTGVGCSDGCDRRQCARCRRLRCRVGIVRRADHGRGLDVVAAVRL